MMVKLDLPALVKMSEKVVIGKVVSRESRRASSEQMLYTYLDIRVSDTLKGTHTDTVRLIVPGGIDERIRTVVWGSANFKLDEEVVLFLKQNVKEASLAEIVGFSQGKFSIVKDQETGEKMVVNDTRDMNVVKPVRKKQVAVGYAPPNHLSVSKPIQIEQGRLEAERLDDFMGRLYKTLDTDAREKGN